MITRVKLMMAWIAWKTIIGTAKTLIMPMATKVAIIIKTKIIISI